MIAVVLRRLACAVICSFTLTAGASSPQAGFGRYRVTVALEPGDDLAALSVRLAATYRASIEPNASEQPGAFLITATEASARLLSTDRAVILVEPVSTSHPPGTAVSESTPSWSTGSYAYDGSGNIKAIGPQESYTYDAFGRLVRGKVDASNIVNYTYDDFGNQVSVKNGDSGTPVRFGVNRDTNRISETTDPNGNAAGGYANYDGEGNVVWTSVGDTFAYDAAGMVKESVVGGTRTIYLYSPADERIASVIISANAAASSTWTIRNPSGAVLTRLTRTAAGAWSREEDYVYRDGKLLAARVNTPERVRHFHPDHLGTPRIITGNGGLEVSRHTYYPFGAEVPSSSTPLHREPLKFTGHERDAGSLDYMHARYYNPQWGRFLSVDPVLDSVDPRRPQSWNRYAYSLNNPLKYLDPDGRTTVVFIVSSGSGWDEKGGHAAVWVESGNQRGGVSRGGYNIAKNGWNDFLAHYTGQGREVHAYILKTTEGQDQAMLDFIKQEGPGGGTDGDKSVQTCGLTENCASGVVNVLQAGGVVPANSDPSAALGANSPFVLKNELDNGQLKPQVQRHIDFVPKPKKESWWSRLIDRIF